MSDDNENENSEVETVTPPPAEESKMPNVPTPEEAAQAKRNQANTVRTGLERKRARREQLTGIKEDEKRVEDGENDTTKKLRAEKDTILKCLTELVEAAQPVHKKDMKQKEWDRFTKARAEADELVRLVQAIPPT